MNYIKLSVNTMPYNRSSKIKSEDYYLGLGGNQQGWIKQLSKFDYQEKRHVDLWYNVFSDFIDCKYFYHTRDKIINKLNLKTFEVSKVSVHLLPQYKWADLNCNYNLLSKQYEIFDELGNKRLEFKFQHPIITKFINSGVLLYQNNEKENNWIKCLNPDGGNEKWRKEFSWQFARLETYENLIIIEYHAYDKIRTDKGYEGDRDWYNPDRYTIVLNGDTGEEIWRYANSYHQIDYENEVVLIGNINSRLPSGKIGSLTVIELNIKNGDILTELEVRPTIERIPNFHFVDKSGIYYTDHEGSFGKISKTDGAILWEFDLIDDNEAKRKLSDWLLLGNGNLVLQATPNHPNGDLTCIFNPEENLEFSKIKNGKRISSNCD